jgi:hypothetical protein
MVDATCWIVSSRVRVGATKQRRHHEVASASQNPAIRYGNHRFSHIP